MTQPTKAQIKEFWEWCGFKKETRWSDPADIVPRHEYNVWVYPDGSGVTQHLSVNPPIDLNNLFKYAVPKVLPEHDFAIYYVLDDRSEATGNWAISMSCSGYGEHGIIRLRDKDPAIALFWALDKVRANDNSKPTGH